jgi:hypothetical protein
MAAKDSNNMVYQLKIALKGSKPPIWRRVLVLNNISLSKLDDIIQTVTGWEGGHLHIFDINGENYGVSDPDFDYDKVLDERKYKLNRFDFREKDKFTYEYDFGDSWEHVITVEKILPIDSKEKYPICLEGKMACPPEDCGGLWGYYNMLDSIKDNEHPENESNTEWLGKDFDPAHFDIDLINTRLGGLS